MFGGITDVFKNIPGLNMLSTAMDLIEGIKTGDMGKILSSVSQLALTYATGGAGAMFGQLLPMLQQAGGANMIASALSGASGVEAGLGAIAMVGKEMGLPPAAIDAAQALFAEQNGDRRAEATNARQAGMGWSLDNKERQQAGVFLDMIKNSPMAQVGPAILAGPDAGPAQLGQAQGIFGNLMESFQTALVQSVLSSMGLSPELISALTGGEAAPGGAESANGAGGADNSGNDLANQRIGDSVREDGEKRKRESKEPGAVGQEILNELGISGGGFFLKFAMIMGEALDRKTGDLMKVAQKMNQEKGFLDKLDANVMEDNGGVMGTGIGSKDEVNQDKQNAFNKGMQESNSRMQTLASIQGGISKEMDALQNAFKTALDSIGKAQVGNARGQ